MTEFAELSEAELDELDYACDGNGEYLCCHRTTNRKTKQPVGGRMIDAVERILAARIATAWDEGYSRCFDPTDEVTSLADNPYRRHRND